MASTCCSEDVSTEPCLSFTVLIQGRCRLLSRSFSFKFGSLTLALMSALRWDWYQHSSNQLSTHRACLHEVFQRRVGIQVKDETRVGGDSCLHEHHTVHLIIGLPWNNLWKNTDYWLLQQKDLYLPICLLDPQRIWIPELKHDVQCDAKINANFTM